MINPSGLECLCMKNPVPLDPISYLTEYASWQPCMNAAPGSLITCLTNCEACLVGMEVNRVFEEITKADEDDS